MQLADSNDTHICGSICSNNIQKKRAKPKITKVSVDGNGRYTCPCAKFPGPSPSAFVGNDYYCESGSVGRADNTYYLSDPLWDGRDCTSDNGCCAQIGMPWFYRKLPVSVAEDFEVRICKDLSDPKEEIGLEKLELYVK